MLDSHISIFFSDWCDSKVFCSQAHDYDKWLLLSMNWINGKQNNSLLWHTHYSDVIMGAMASQITSLTIVHTSVSPGADQRKHRHWPLIGEFTDHRWIRGKCFHLMTSSCFCCLCRNVFDELYLQAKVPVGHEDYFFFTIVIVSVIKSIFFPKYNKNTYDNSRSYIF